MNALSIFISYSHADLALVAELLKRLKVVEHLGLIPWVDHQDMTSGQDFDREIQRELAKCAAAVLVVSPDFLASDYVRKHELPVIMAAHKERGLLVLPLYLRHCGHQHLPDAVRFSSILALNDPKEPIESFHDNDRDRQFAEAVDKLLDAMRKAQPTPAFDPSTVPILSIALTRSGDQLLRQYRTNEPVAEHKGPWSLPAANNVEALYSLLFPPSPHEGHIAAARALGEAFGQPIGPVPTPALGPLRIRLVTDIDDMLRLRWTEATWQGKPLWERGWTVEFGRTLDVRGLEEIELPGPMWLLLDQDDHAGISAAATKTDLLEVWDRTYPKSPDHPSVLHRWPTAEDVARLGSPTVLIYAGRASHRGAETVVTLLDETGAPSTRPIATLFSSRPQATLLSLQFPIGEPTAIMPTTIAADVPLVIAQGATIAERDAARTARVSWWNDFLAGRDPDPIISAHRHALVHTQVFTDRKRILIERRAPSVARLVALRLDRVVQKTRTQREVQKLFQQGTPRRSCALVVHGATSNRVDLFHRQLHADLHQHASEAWNLVMHHLALPAGASFTQEEVETEVRRHWSLRSGPSIAAHIRGSLGADEMSADVNHVVLLAFGVRGGRHAPLPTSHGIDAWLRFCVGQFDQGLGANVRVLALLQLEEPDEALVRHLDAARAVAEFRPVHFLYLPLEPLDKVPLGDLIEHIDEPDSGCPDDLRAEFPNLLHQVTGGDFDQTTQWLERAHRESWYTIADELRNAGAAEPSPAAKDATT